MAGPYNYQMIVAQWRDICSRPLSPAEKTSHCLAILRDVLGRLAVNAWRTRNPPFYFYLYMVMLHRDVKPRMGVHDELGRCALLPAFILLDEWLKAHCVAKTI